MTLMILVGLLILSVPPGIAAAQAGQTEMELTLAGAQDYAVKHNAQTENARLDVAMARKKIWETVADGLPQVTANVSYMNNLQIPTTLIPAEFLDPDAKKGEFIGVKFGTQHNATAEISISQMIFNGSYLVGLQATRVYLRLSQEQLIKSTIELKATVADNYYLILLLEDNKTRLETGLKNIRDTLYQTRELHKAGFAADTDADQLQLAVTDLENAVKSMTRQITIAYNLLKFNMGMDLDRPIRLSDSLDQILADLDSADLLESPLDLPRHIDYRIPDTWEKSMKLLLKNEKSTYLPRISAFLSYSRMAFRESFSFFKSGETWFPSSALGLSINIPIFSSGMRGARVAQARMELKKAVNSKNRAIQGLRLQLNQARADFSDALEKTHSNRQNVKLAQKIYDKTRERYNAGTASSLELTQVHNQYLTAESNYTTAAVQLLNAKTRLEKALNRLETNNETNTKN